VFKGALARAGTEEANPTRYFTQEELGRLFEASPAGLEVSHTQRHLNAQSPTQVRFCRYRFCATGELKYRGAVGRRQVHCTLIVKIIRFYC
jgi:hypothetical protein